MTHKYQRAGVELQVAAVLECPRNSTCPLVESGMIGKIVCNAAFQKMVGLSVHTPRSDIDKACDVTRQEYADKVY